MSGADLAVVLIDVALLGILGVISIALIRLRSLFAVVMLSGVYSLTTALWFVAMDAVDVAFTEAAVGAGVSTVLMLGAMLLTARTAKRSEGVRLWGPLVVCVAVGATLFYATLDLPTYGAADSPANAYVGHVYLERAAEDIGMPNVVTAVLASYRGFDTFGETSVIFAAGVAVALLLGFGERALFTTAGRRRRKREDEARADEGRDA